MLGGAEEIGLLSLADMYLYFYKNDGAYRYAIEYNKDHTAKELDPDTVHFPSRWTANDANPDDAWGLRGMGLFSLASIHLWRHGIPFNYLDIGANVGATTFAQAIFNKRCGRSNRVHAFEPGNVFLLLIKGVTANNLDGVTCINMAASDSKGEVTFYLTPRQSPAGSLIKEAVDRKEVEEQRAIKVQTITIDEYVDTAIAPSSAILAKIDTEGADFKVLAGMKKTIRNRFCVMQIEFFPSLMNYTDPADRLRQLANDFYLIDIGDAPHRIIDAEGIPALMERVSLLPMPMTDIFMIAKAIPESGVLRERIVQG